MYNKKSARDPISSELFGMTLAVAASWQSPDPYFPNGAAILDGKDVVQAVGYSKLMEKTDKSIAWDSQAVMRFMIRAEQDVLKRCGVPSVSATWTLYCTSLPHPEALKAVLENGIFKIVYGPQKGYGLDKNSRSVCEALVKAIAGYQGSIEPFKSNMNFLFDKLHLMKNQVPNFFE